jgi:hypothetical protein
VVTRDQPGGAIGSVASGWLFDRTGACVMAVHAVRA